MSEPLLSLESYRVELAMMRMRPPFDRPLRMGDAEQIAALELINGDRVFCSHCLREPNCAGWMTEGQLNSILGGRCKWCRQGILLPGSRREVSLPSQLQPESLPELFAEVLG